MTRKDYVALAEALKNARPIDEEPIPGAAIRNASVRIARLTWERACDAISAVLAADNPRFDRERFVKACERERL